MLRSTISWLEHLQIKKVVGGNVGRVVGKTVFFYIWLWNIEKNEEVLCGGQGQKGTNMKVNYAT
jgi:hypothetical protein